jgi:Lipocalin-like domain
MLKHLPICAALTVLGAESCMAQKQVDDSAKLTGTWKLISAVMVMEDVETKEQKLLWGEHPNGYIDRWIVVQTAEGRATPKIDEDRSTAFRTMLAYSGKFRTEGNKVIIKVDIAWDESWNGTEQVRFYRVDEDKLYIEAAPQPYANFDGKVMRGILIWARE